MGSRSRKRGRTTQTAPAGRGPRAKPTTPGGHGASARPAAPTGTGSATPGAEPVGRTTKTEAKNQAVRETLEPLAEGERPPWVTYAAIFATVLGLSNVVLYAAGVRVADAGIGSAVIQGAILLVCAAGLWRAKYWAVLGFEVLMGVTTTFGSLSLLVASSLRGAAIAVGVVLVCGTFFWKLIRAMARIQMPERPGARRA